MRVENFLKEHGLPLLLIALIVLAGYHKVFLGATFLTTENNLATSNYTYGTTSNGWRPDKGMGLSFFFADAGMWHPWAPLVWWERIMPSRETAYNSSIILLGMLAAFAQYFLIRKILPESPSWFAVLIAPLVVFCADQDGYHYLRVYISYLFAIPAVLIILYDQFNHPRFVNILKLTFVFWMTAFFGTLWGLFQLLSLGFFFTLLYCLYHPNVWFKVCRRFVIICAPAVVMVILLGFGEFYSLFYEKSVIGYMREKMLAVLPSIHLGLDIKGTVDVLRAFFLMEWYPHNTTMIGLPAWPLMIQYYVAVIFPFVLLAYMFRKNLSFWEFVFKWLVLISFIHFWLSRTNLIPGFGAVYSYLNEATTKLFTIYGMIYPLQVPLIALFIWRLTKDNVKIPNAFGQVVRKIFAWAIMLPFVFLAVLSFFVVVFPDFLSARAVGLMNQILPVSIHGVDRSFLIEIVEYNLWCLKHILTVPSIMYYALSAVVAGVFVSDRWLARAVQLPKMVLAAIILLNGILLSWAIFPLSKVNRVWEQEAVSAYTFGPTDRFYYVSGRSDNLKRKLELFHRNWSLNKNALTATIPVGLLEPPGLNISGLKSFAPEAEGQWVYEAFNGDGTTRLVHLRLYYGGPLYVSDLLDISAVKYYYSDKPLENLPSQLTPFAEGNGLYVYKNTKAWDYFYLADRLRVSESLKDIKDVIPKTAYVSSKDMFELRDNDPTRKAVLKEFHPGRMVFEYEGSSDAMLVVADAWHPFWKASANGENIPVLKVNGIFKGVRLKSGHYNVTMLFDHSPYRFGIYISIFAWLIFLVLCVWSMRVRKV